MFVSVFCSEAQEMYEEPPSIANRKRYGRRKRGDVDGGESAEPPKATGIQVVTQAPKRLINAINPFGSSQQASTVPQVKARTPNDPFTLEESCQTKKSPWGWRTSRPQPATEPAGSLDESGAVVFEVGPLVREARDPKSIAGRERSAKQAQRQELLKEAITMNQENVDTITRIERVANVTENIGERTIVILQQQSDQIQDAQNQVEDLSPMMNRAKMEMVAIARQLVKDKIFVCLCCSVIAALILLVVIVARKSISGATAGEDEATAAPPQTPAPTA